MKMITRFTFILTLTAIVACSDPADDRTESQKTGNYEQVKTDYSKNDSELRPEDQSYKNKDERVVKQTNSQEVESDTSLMREEANEGPLETSNNTRTIENSDSVTGINKVEEKIDLTETENLKEFKMKTQLKITKLENKLANLQEKVEKLSDKRDVSLSKEKQNKKYVVSE